MLLLRLLRALAASLSASVRTDATLFVGSGTEPTGYGAPG